MKYIFAFGRDHAISKLELTRVLEFESVEYEIINDLGRFLVVEFKNQINLQKLIERLAGTIKIACIDHELENMYEFDPEKLDFYFPGGFEIRIVNINTSQDTVDYVASLLHSFAKSSRSKGNIKEIVLDHIAPKEKQKDDDIEIVLYEVNNKLMIATTKAYADNKIYQFKDTKRPVQKFTHGSSFRLARMMVNILALPEGKIMVDPFCGIGTFLIEGLERGNRVIGIDFDGEVAHGARKNLAWATKAFNLPSNYQVINGDSREVEFKADGCAFEPYMGPFLKKNPTISDAKQICNSLHEIYNGVFANLRKSMPIGSLVVCIIPEFPTNDGNILKLTNDFFVDNKFKQEITPPIDYFTPSGSFINRKLWIFQKTA